MKRTTFFFSLVLSVLFLGLVSCGDSNDTADDGSGKTNSSSSSEGTSPAQAPGNGSKGTIGMTCMNLNNPFFQLIAQEMEKAAAEAGYTLKAMDGKGDAALQNTQIDEFITQKCDAIFLNPADSKATGSGVRAAHTAGIPVFTFDIQMEDPEVQGLVTYHVGSDNYQGGKLAGESMMKATGDTGKIGIINLPEANSCKKRVDGFKDYLKENNSKLEIVIELNGKGDRVKGAEVTADMLTAHDDLVGIFGINDPCALGAWPPSRRRASSNKSQSLASTDRLMERSESSRRNSTTRPCNSPARWPPRPWKPFSSMSRATTSRRSSSFPVRTTSSPMPRRIPTGTNSKSGLRPPA